MRKPRAYILDSWAIMAFLGDEPSGAKVADLIADAHENGVPVLMTSVNVGEVWYVVARQVSDAEAETSVRQLRELGIEFRVVDWEVARHAARFKTRHKMSYADCFVAALAKTVKGSVLVTGDKEFSSVEPEVVIRWLA